MKKNTSPSMVKNCDKWCDIVIETCFWCHICLYAGKLWYKYINRNKHNKSPAHEELQKSIPALVPSWSYGEMQLLLITMMYIQWVYIYLYSNMYIFWISINQNHHQDTTTYYQKQSSRFSKYIQLAQTKQLTSAWGLISSLFSSCPTRYEFSESMGPTRS